MKKLPFLMVYAFWAIACALKQNPWVNDLDFMYKAILENHPGVYNHADPHFREKLENAYRTVRSALTKATVKMDAKIMLSDFAQTFHDTHLWVHWSDNTGPKQNNVPSKFFIWAPSHDVAWIVLPTFALKSNQEKDFKALVTQISDLRKKKYIVFDLRGNQGGNSDYGAQIVNALFGHEYADHKKCLHNQKVFVDWRASQGNLSHISFLLTKDPTNQWLQRIKKGLKKSLEKGDIFYREYSDETCGPQKNIMSDSGFDFKVIVITDSCNVSAALDFIDELKMMTKKFILIGQKTKADRVYMEVRSLPLPSGSGTFSFPIKVYRNRPRLDNEPYIPNIEFNDVDHLPDLKSFILSIIKRERATGAM